MLDPSVAQSPATNTEVSLSSEGMGGRGLWEGERQRISKDPGKVQQVMDLTKLQPGALDYQQIDEWCKEEGNASLYELCCSQCPELKAIYPSEDSFKTFVASGGIPQILIGKMTEGVLFNSYAEESNLRRNTDGSLSMVACGGMNIPTDLVRDMLNELFNSGSATIGPDGRLHGVGKITVDAGSEENGIEITIDFDQGTISPPLRLEYGHRATVGEDGQQVPYTEDVTVEDLTKFIGYYTSGPNPILTLEDGVFVINPGRSNDCGTSILLPRYSTRVMAHELYHALYDNSPDYQKAIFDRVRQSSPEEREAALLFLLTLGYDILDPDAVSVTRDMVVDEAFNAYTNEGGYDPKTTESSRASIGGFCRRFGVGFSFDSLSSLQELKDKYGLSNDEMVNITRSFQDSGVSESEFLHDFPELILDQIHSMLVLRQLLLEQHPEIPGMPDFYDRFAAARCDLIDFVDTAGDSFAASNTGTSF